MNHRTFGVFSVAFKVNDPIHRGRADGLSRSVAATTTTRALTTTAGRSTTRS